jgi:hypothetical protein
MEFDQNSVVQFFFRAPKILLWILTPNLKSEDLSNFQIWRI